MVQGMAYAATVKEQIFNSIYIQGLNKKKAKGVYFSCYKDTWIKLVTIKIIHQKKLKIRIHQVYALGAGKGNTGEINMD